MKVIKNKVNTQSKIIIFIMFAGFLSIVFQFILKNVFWDVLNIRNDWVVKFMKTGENPRMPERVDEEGWKVKYPFVLEPAYEQMPICSTRVKSKNDIQNADNIFTLINKLYNMADQYASEYFTLIEQAEIMSKAFSKCLGMNLLIDTYGNLTYFQKDGRMMAERQYKTMECEIRNICNFAEWLDKKDIRYLYVTIPSPVDPKDEMDQIAMGYEEYTNVMADELLTGLIINGVSILDLREKMNEDNRSWTEGFFLYDHHMVLDNGLWTAKKVADEIDKIMNIVTDNSLFDLDNYAVTKSEPVGTGAFYDTVTMVYAGKTEMEMFHPTFETMFTKVLPRYDMTLAGTFDEVMYSMYDYPEYNMYNHGIQPLKLYVNHDQSVAKIKILLLTDSYSDVISPFLACAYSNIDEIDLRLFDGSLQAYIEETNPDLIVCMYGAYDLNFSGAEALFEFK